MKIVDTILTFSEEDCKGKYTDGFDCPIQRLFSRSTNAARVQVMSDRIYLNDKWILFPDELWDLSDRIADGEDVTDESFIFPMPEDLVPIFYALGVGRTELLELKCQ